MRLGRVLVAMALVAASLAAAGCSGQGGSSACPPVAGTVTTAVDDNLGVLVAKVWLPVVSSKGQYGPWLKPLDVASRSLTTAELDGILAADGAERDAAIQGAVSEIPKVEQSALPDTPTPIATPSDQPVVVDAGRHYELLVPSSPVGKAVGDFYTAALVRQGHTADVTVDTTEHALNTVAAGKVDGQVALMELPDLSSALGAFVSLTGLSGQLRAATSVAARRSLALGAPTAANRTPQVLVTKAFAAAHGGVSDLSALAQACPGLAVTATGNTVGSLAPLTAAYGLRTAIADDDAVEHVRSGATVAALVPAVHRAG
jgi:hypothetical protein